MANGLLDFISTPEGQGLLSAAFGGLVGARRGQPFNSIGRAGLAGLSGYVDAQDRVTQQDERAKINQMRDLQLKQAQQAQADAEARKALAQQSMMSPGAMAVSQNGGPTLAAAQALPTTQPGFDFNRYAAGLAGLGDVQGSLAIQQAMKKAPRKLMAVAPGNVVLDEETGQPTFTAPNKPEGLPEGMRMGANGPEYIPAYLEGRRKIAAAGASNVVVGDNLGLKPKDRFEMEDKLRNDYTAATASDSTVVSASQNIGSLLKQGGALKDQGAIYSFAKLLDPLGAVREADYAAIVKTAGGLDYVTSLFNRALTGEQLSQKQRLEMDRVATSMANVAKQRIAKQQKRFTGTAKMYNLQPENVFQTSEEATAADPLGLRK